MTEPRSRGWNAALALSLLLFAASLAWYSFQQARRPLLPSFAAQHTEQLAAAPTVLLAVRDLARLESVSFHMERVIDLKDKQSRFFGAVDVEDAILLVAAGDVVAGIDLAQLDASDISVDSNKHSVQLRMPAPEILSVNLDSQRTYVHSRHTDLLAVRELDLETRARQRAEEAIRAAAIEAGILRRAHQNAEQVLSALVRSLGYQRLELQ